MKDWGADSTRSQRSGIRHTITATSTTQTSHLRERPEQADGDEGKGKKGFRSPTHDGDVRMSDTTPGSSAKIHQETTKNPHRRQGGSGFSRKNNRLRCSPGDRLFLLLCLCLHFVLHLSATIFSPFFLLFHGKQISSHFHFHLLPVSLTCSFLLSLDQPAADIMSYGSGGGGGGGGPKSHREWNPECKVYIGNLSEGSSKNDVEHAFGKYGPLRNVWVARNPPGFAFVEYEDRRDAEDAVRGLDGTKIAGARVRVELSHGRSRRGGFHSDRGGGRPPYPPRGGGRYGSPPPAHHHSDYRDDRGRRGDSRERVPRYRDAPPRGGRSPRSRSRSPPPRRAVPSRYSRSPGSPHRGHGDARGPDRRLSRSISRSPIPERNGGGRGDKGSPNGSPVPMRGVPRTPPSRSRSISPPPRR